MTIQIQSANDRALSLPLLLPVLIGVSLLYSALTAFGSSLWLDELYTVAASDPHQSLATLLRTQMAVDTNPPLYYAAAHGWTLLFGTSEVAYRSLSLLFAVLTVPAAFLLGRQSGDRESADGGAAVAALICTTPAFVIYAQEARAYAMLLFACTAVLAATVRVLRAIDCRKLEYPMLAAQCAAMAVAGLTHYFGYLMAGLAGIGTLLAAWRVRGLPARLVCAYAVPALILVGWFVYHAGHMQFERTPAWFTPESAFRAAMSVATQSLGLLLGKAGAAAIAVCCVYAAIRSPHEVVRGLRRPEAVLPIAIAIGACLSAVVVAFLVGTSAGAPESILKSRNFIILLPTLAVAIWTVLRTGRRTEPVWLVAICALALLGSAVLARENRDLLSWREPAAAIRSRPECAGQPILTVALGVRIEYMYLYYTEPVRPIFIPLAPAMFAADGERLRLAAAEVLMSPCPVKFWGAHLPARAIPEITAAFRTLDPDFEFVEYRAGTASHLLVVRSAGSGSAVSPRN